MHQYKGYTLTKNPFTSCWEVEKDGVVLEGCSSLAYAKKYVTDLLASQAV